MKTRFNKKAGASLASITPLLALLLLAANPGHAGTVTWTNTSGDAKWSTLNNWSSGALPGVNDIAVLGASATSTVSITTAASVGTLNFGAAAVNDITLNLGSNLRIQTGITVDAGDGYNSTISGGRTIYLGNASSGLTGTSTVTFTNNSSHLFSISSAASDINMGTTGAAGATINLVVAGAGSTSISSKIWQAVSTNASTLNLTKNGSGTLTLTNTASVISGTATVNAGTLTINGALTAGGGFIINSGGTLGGTGTLTGATTINGTLAPGNSIGTINTGSLTLASTSVLDVELGRNGTTATSDLTNVAGTVVIESGADLNLTRYSGLSDLLSGDVVFLINNNDTDAVQGSFTSLNGVTTALSEGSQFSWNSQSWKITYTADSTTTSFTGGNDIALMVVPEPSTWAMMLGGIGLLAFGQRLRRRTVQ